MTGQQREVGGVTVYGVDVDPCTRCRHWHGDNDVIALRFACCDQWFCCFDCHQALADHVPAVWPQGRRDVKAVLCGACGHSLRIDEYLACDSTCPACGAAFNPGCARHYHLYFEVDEADYGR